MANPTKFTAKEVLNKVLLDSSGNAVSANSVTSQEALSMALDATNNRLNVALEGGTISGDVTIAGDLTVNGGGSMAFSEVLTGDFQIVGANGTVSGTPDVDGDEFIIRNNADAGMSILAGESDGHTSSVVFGSASDLNGANISYEYNDKLMMVGTQHASGILKLRSGNGTDAMTIDASQNATFAGDVKVINNLVIDSTAADTAEQKIQFHDDNVGLQRASGANRSNNGNSLYISAFEDIVFSASGAAMASQTEVMRIDGSTSRVGIGTSSPTGLFSIYKSGGAPEMIWEVAGNSGARNWGWRASGSAWGDFQLRQGSSLGGALDTARITILDGGNVGIGGTPTAAKLEIHGGGYNTSLLIKGSGSHTGIKFVDSGGTTDGLIYAEGGEIGFLDDDEQWAVKVVTDTSTSLLVNNSIKLLVDANSRISLSNNDGGNTGNTIFGKSAWNHPGDNDASDYNTIVGELAMGTGTIDAASNNTGIGYKALTSLTTGDSNTAIGSNSGFTLSTGIRNTFIGNSAGYTTVDVDNAVFIGYNAGSGGNITDAADGTIGIGVSALAALTSGVGATVVGYQAGDAITGGDYNTAIGYQALSTEDTGDRNTAVGYGSLLNVNGANDNANTALGYLSGTNISTGTKNVAIGADSGGVLASGNYNTLIGHTTAPNASDGENQIVIGYHAAGKGDNKVTIGNGDITDVYMAEDSGATVHCAQAVVTEGINFPDDASANPSGDVNTLDNYEEGEHTTAITGATSGSWVLDSAQNKLSYTKIGRMVTVVGKFETDSGSGSGTLKISLPFTSADLTAGAGIAAGSITINRYGSTSIATQITPIVFEGTNYINIQKHNTDGTSNEGYIQADDIDAIFEGQLSITYFAA